ncbi:MAG: hypothetical protein SF187_09610 [Deltaproteobacteria bacterium]|nr:hypothetical protein [Deltaproteobacteria bacterium]
MKPRGLAAAVGLGLWMLSASAFAAPARVQLRAHACVAINLAQAEKLIAIELSAAGVEALGAQPTQIDVACDNEGPLVSVKDGAMAQASRRLTLASDDPGLNTRLLALAAAELIVAGRRDNVHIAPQVVPSVVKAAAPTIDSPPKPHELEALFAIGALRLGPAWRWAPLVRAGVLWRPFARPWLAITTQALATFGEVSTVAGNVDAKAFGALPAVMLHAGRGTTKLHFMAGPFALATALAGHSTDPRFDSRTQWRVWWGAYAATGVTFAWRRWTWGIEGHVMASTSPPEARVISGNVLVQRFAMSAFAPGVTAIITRALP